MAANTFPSTNSKISNLINSQVPFFVRNDHPNFIKFIEAYYEWLEQADGQVSGIANTTQYNVVTRAKNINNYYNIDKTITQFADQLNKQFLKLIPEGVTVDKALLLKNIKDFYRAKGTEKSAELLINILFGGNKSIDFYYPKVDILRASDGKWFVEKSIKVTDIQTNGISNSSPDILNLFNSRLIVGNTSGANAIVEKVDTFFESGILIKELKISAQKGDFINGETLYTTFTEGNETKSLTANIFGGIISSYSIVSSGNGYISGTQIPIVSNTGSNGVVAIGAVTSGSLSSIGVIKRGSGFRVNDLTLITGGGGSGALGNVTVVLDDSSVHPNSYNIAYSTISLEANTLLSNAVYSNLNSSNANTTLANSLSFYVYGNTGPIFSAGLISGGSNYTSIPTIDIIANTNIRSLGILGSMEIVSGGVGYVANDKIYFENVGGGYGTGALGNVKTVNATGSITTVEFIKQNGHIIGGSGYSQSYLPIANVISTNVNAYGANVVVTSVLGDGEVLSAVTTSIGKIQSIVIISGGKDYDSNTTLDLTNLGDGTARVNVGITEGLYTYPGRYLNDDGKLSSYNFLEDRDYYQNFSYVVKVNESIDKFKQALLDLTHPTGMKLFGEYVFIDDTYGGINVKVAGTSNTKEYIEYENIKYRLADLNANLTPGITISMNTYGLQENSEVYLSFTSGNVASYEANNIYYVSNIINSNAVLVYTGTKIPASMNVFNRDSTPTGLYFREDGKIMYMIGFGRRVNMYDLLYPWDISSAKFRTRSAVNISVAAPSGVYFSSNGKFMYVSGQNTGLILQYSLDESWNVNVATLITSYNVGSREMIVTDVCLSNDGNYLYTTGFGNNRVLMYTLGTAWNVNTANYKSNISVSSKETLPRGIHFREDGKIMYLIGTATDIIHQYNLTESWNIETAIYTTNTAPISNVETLPQSVFLNRSGDVAYFTGSNNDIIVQAPLGESWNIASINLDRFNTTGNTGNVNVMKNIN